VLQIALKRLNNKPSLKEDKKMTIKAYAALTTGGKLEPFEYDPEELGVDQVEIDISSCGICHSDLSMLTMIGK
jgi:hypothetical protein